MTARRFGYIGALRNFTLIYEYVGDCITRKRYFSTRLKLEAFITQNFLVVHGIYWRGNFNKNIMDRYL